MGKMLLVFVIVAVGAGCFGQTRDDKNSVSTAADEVAEGDPATRGDETRPAAIPVREHLYDRTDPADQPEELGAVAWLRNLEHGQEESRATGKPILLLFTEVPGCNTVKRFANGPLSNALLVETIEDLFVPVAIYNNVGGYDREVLQRFEEPTWNNPVVRVVDADLQGVSNRYASDWSTASFAGYLKGAVRDSGRTPPGYLETLVYESNASKKTAVFSMYCFWTGEVKLAGLPGVVSTRPGFLAGREVVEVTYNGRETDIGRLADAAAAAGAASGFVARDRAQKRAVSERIGNVVVDPDSVRYSAKDDKYQVREFDLESAGLTPAQATRFNRSWVTGGESATQWLSPRQVEILGI